jgi:hypothetical protein
MHCLQIPGAVVVLDDVQDVDKVPVILNLLNVIDHLRAPCTSSYPPAFA